MKGIVRSVMLADANFCTLPLLSSLKKNGMRVSVCGNLLSDPCHELADQSFGFDYSKKEELLAVVKDKHFSYLVPGCNDQSYLSSSWVAEQCGLPGYDPFDTVLTLHHKDKFRNFAIKQGYPTPRVAYSLEDTEKLEYPLIVKPIDAFSGRGTQKVTDKEKLSQAVDDACYFSINKQAVIEEFKTGSLHSHSAFIKNGEISYDFFVDEYCTVYPYQVNSSCLSTNINSQLRKDIRDCITQLTQDLRLVDGLLHTQLLINGDDYWLIEVTRRCPGDLYSRLIELSTGFNYSKAYISPFIEQRLPVFNELSDQRHYARHTVSTDQVQSFFSVSHALNVKSTEVIQLKTCGKVIKEAPFDKAGIVFVEFESEHEKAAMTPELKHHVTIKTLDNLQVNQLDHV